MWDQEAQESQTNINLQSAVNALPYPDQVDHFQTENEMSNTFPEHQYQETITVCFHSEVLYFYLD